MTGPVSETVYSRAADVIRDRGWWDGSMTPEADSSVCTLGALAAAARGMGASLLPAAKALCAHLGIPNRGIPDWNDAPGRSVEDVFLVLKKLHVQEGGQ